MRRFLGLDFTFEQVYLRDEHHCTILDQISHVVRADDDVVYLGYKGAGKRADAHWISLMVEALRVDRLDVAIRQTCLCRPESNR